MRVKKAGVGRTHLREAAGEGLVQIWCSFWLGRIEGKTGIKEEIIYQTCIAHLPCKLSYMRHEGRNTGSNGIKS